MRYSSLRLYAVAMLAMLLVTVAASPARAQFIGYTSPQTVQQTLATNIACTGAQQLFTVQNLGQNQHFATLSITSTATEVILMNMVGVDASGLTNVISDTMVGAGTAGISTATLYGTGYFPIVRISVTCASAFGTFTLTYSGTSANTPIINGNYQAAQQVKRALGSGAGTTISTTFQTPFGSSGALLRAHYNVAAVAASTITISCNSIGGAGSAQAFIQATFALANNTLDQSFKIPSGKCFSMTVQYNSGGASVGTINADVLFDQPGTSDPNVALYAHIAGTTATNVKGTQGVVTQVLIGTSAAGTVTLHDLLPAACTATPATGIVSVITALVGGAPVPIPLNLFFNNGICVKASAVMDITVGFQ